MRTALALSVCLIGCATAPEPTKAPPKPEAPARPLDVTPPVFRLPETARPTRASLNLTIDPEQTSLHGTATYDVELREPTDVLWLHGEGLSISAAALDGKQAVVLKGGEDFVGVHLAAPLQKGHVELSLLFSAPIDREKSRGVYSETENGLRYAYTFFEPTDARRAFPCFDEPSFKIPWTLTFHVPRALVARANAPIASETEERDGLKKVVFAESKPMPSYLVAFMVGPFEVIDGGTAGRAATPIHFILPRGREAELRYAKEITPKVVTALEDFFDLPYPFVKLDVAVVPRYWGTMEHPGLVAMGQPLSLIRPEQETRNRQEAYTDILAHELGHYWFGDLVTLAWWDDTWLNESLGQWLDVVITDAAVPQWHVREDVSRALDAMSRDEALSAKRIRQPVTSPQDIEASFDGALTYNKGSAVLNMFEHALGAGPWRDFLRGYVRAHAWGNVTADDFLVDLGAKFGAERAEQFRTFLVQPGVPLIRSKVQCVGGKATLELIQQRSLPAGTTDDAQHEWKLPVCIRFGDAKTEKGQCVELQGRSSTVPLDRCPTWLMLNAAGAGYYRSALATDTFKDLLTRHASVTEKQMLVADLVAAVARNEVPIDQQLALVPVVAADLDPRVAIEAVGLSSFPSSMLDDATWKQARAWRAKTFGALARKLGWQRSAGDTDETHRLRTVLLWTIADDDPALRAEGLALARKWLETRSGLDDELVDVALSIWARHGTAADFERAVELAVGARDRMERGRFFGALSNFVEPALVTRALQLVEDRRFDQRETRRLLAGLLHHRETRPAAWTWVEAHADGLLANMRDDEAGWFLGDLATTCTPEALASAKALVEPRAPKYAGAENAVRAGLESSAQCVEQLQRQLPILQRFLKERGRSRT